VFGGRLGGAHAKIPGWAMACIYCWGGVGGWGWTAASRAMGLSCDWGGDRAGAGGWRTRGPVPLCSNGMGLPGTADSMALRRPARSPACTCGASMRRTAAGLQPMGEASTIPRCRAGQDLRIGFVRQSGRVKSLTPNTSLAGLNGLRPRLTLSSQAPLSGCTPPPELPEAGPGRGFSPPSGTDRAAAGVAAA
jgi:hypothetical protein